MLRFMAQSQANVTEDKAAQAEDAALPTVVVKRFLELLEAGDVDGAVELLAVDVRYENVGLPTVYGRERVRQIFRAAYRRPGAGFEAHLHTVSADGNTVMTERTDVLKVRRIVVQLWVCGRFDVHDGQIVLWRDYFDYANFTLALMRGLLGVALPALRATPPATA
jgi:limonene-1,2-epoxide hydrolase